MRALGERGERVRDSHAKIPMVWGGAGGGSHAHLGRAAESRACVQGVADLTLPVFVGRDDAGAPRTLVGDAALTLTRVVDLPQRRAVVTHPSPNLGGSGVEK